MNKDIFLSDEYQRVYSKALAYVTGLRRTESELVKKLSSLTEYVDEVLSLAITEDIIREFKSSKIICDSEYALDYVEQQLRSPLPKSPLEIQSFLYRKGISRSEIDSALLLYTSDAQCDAIKKYINVKRFSDDKKAIQYLGRKGFDYSLIKSILSSI